jgi:hypothetical protein
MLRRCTGGSMGKIRQQLQALRGARLWVTPASSAGGGLEALNKLRLGTIVLASSHGEQASCAAETMRPQTALS